MTQEVYLSRIQEVQSALRELGFGAQLVGSMANLCYLTGVLPMALERLTLLILPAQGEPHLIVPRLSLPEFFPLEGLIPFLVWEDGQDPLEIVHSELKRFPGNLILALDRGVQGRVVLELARALSPHLIQVSEEALSLLRQRKDPEEVELLKKAGEIADRALAQAVEALKPGMSELEVASIIVNSIMKEGAEADPPLPIVASGPNCAIPHHHTGPRKIERGDSVVIDFGCLYRNYHSDMTRTIFVGDPDPEFLKVYEVVKEAQARALKAVRPEIPLGKLDEISREHITQAGYGPYFTHRLGHGLGLEIHEEPYLYSGNPAPAAPGMCFSVEPGIYLPGRFGVRIEDCVVVQEGEPLVLTKFPKKLIAK